MNGDMCQHLLNTVCMYYKCVCTPSVSYLNFYILKLCMYSKCVCSQIAYVLKLCMYSKLFVLKLCLYYNCVCTPNIWQQYSYKSTCPFPYCGPPGLYSHPLTVTSNNSSYTYYFTSDIYFIYSPF
jgi:hypothetical protein